MLRKALITTAVLAVCAISALILWTMRDKDAASKRSNERVPTESRLAAMENRLTRLARAQRAQTMRSALTAPAGMTPMKAAAARVDRRQDAPGPREELEPETEAERRALQRQQLARELEAERKHFEGLYQKFANEPVDGVWADGVKASLKRSFTSSKLAKVGSLAMSCRTSWCAVDLSYAPGKGAGSSSQREVVNWLNSQDCGAHVPGHVTLDGRPLKQQRIYLDCAKRRVN